MSRWIQRELGTREAVGLGNGKEIQTVLQLRQNRDTTFPLDSGLQVLERGLPFTLQKTVVPVSI